VDQPVEHAESPGGFLPQAPDRRMFESVFARIVATAGVVGIGTALAAILGAVDAASWVIGLVVSLVSVVLAAILWRSRTL
jgi:hypothetical protein